MSHLHRGWIALLYISGLFHELRKIRRALSQRSESNPGMTRSAINARDAKAHEHEAV
jgi:hypothetical protein